MRAWLIALILAIHTLGAGAQVADDCVAAGWTGNCKSTIGDGSVDIHGSRGQTGTADGGGTDDGGRASQETTPNDGINCDDPLRRCGVYEVVVRQEPTIADVASFAPRVAQPVPEPSGFGVAGMPVNVVASARQHTEEGEIFDLPVRVRFRPVAFAIDYGDGTTRTSDSGGRTWASLGLPQFAPTETSHVYRQRGTYSIEMTVAFAADVDFGHGWSRVPGLLHVPAGSTTIRVVEARTALVERTCREDPAGVGC